MGRYIDDILQPGCDLLAGSHHGFHHEAAHDAGAFPVRLSNVTRTQNGKRTNQKARIHSGAVSGKQPGSDDSERLRDAVMLGN